MRFQEKTGAETGFSKVWDSQIAPHLRRYRAEFVAKRRILYLGIFLYPFIPLPGLIYGAQFFPPPFEEGAGGIYLLGAVLASLGWVYLFGMGFFGAVRRFDEFMRRSVAKHFAPIFHQEPIEAAADTTAFMLQSEGMGKKGEILISNYHVGTYRDCALQFFNVCYKRREMHSRGGRRTKRNHNLVLDISVPVAFEGKVYIKRDYGFVLNWLRGQVIRKRRYKVKHEGFEAKFEIYADDPRTAQKLITRSFCNNLMAVERMYPKGFGILPRPITGLFRQGHFYLIIGGVRDMMSDGISYSHPDKVQQTARRMIARLAIMPRIVDFLHGMR